MKVYCKKCGKYLFEVEPQKPMKIKCWWCGFENIVNNPVDFLDNMFGGVFNGKGDKK